MTRRPFLKDAERLNSLLSELTFDAIKIAEIELVLARTFADGHNNGWNDSKNEDF